MILVKYQILKILGNIISKSDNIVALGGICGVLYNNSIVEYCENDGILIGEGNLITPNEDLNQNVNSCTNNGGGNVTNVPSGELHVGLVYGKLENV